MSLKPHSTILSFFYIILNMPARMITQPKENNAFQRIFL